MKLYTRTGDTGSTRLFGNKEVSKSDIRVQAYGDVDELNSAIGLVLVSCQHEELSLILTAVQHSLFDVGADLSTPARKTQEGDLDPGSENAMGTDLPETRITIEDAAALEVHIDNTCEPLPPMTQFILPGGSEIASRLHLARTICRRAERNCVQLSMNETGIADAIVYLNRLSDLLFALARRANQLDEIDDVVWQKKADAK